MNGYGSFVFEETPVTNIKNNPVNDVYTEQGIIAAKNVIIATHTPIDDISSLPDLYVMSTKIAPYRSYVIGVKLRSPVPVGLFWDKDSPYHYTLSPVCTHAGCIFNWNNAERTWDCPCHGGRFSTTGEVLNGPPITDLNQKPLPTSNLTKG